MTPRAINISKNHAGNVIMHSTKKDFCPEKKTKMRTKGSNFSPNPTVIALAYILWIHNCNNNNQHQMIGTVAWYG